MPKITKNRLLLGGHMSIAGGIEKAFERGENIGCNSMQIFTKNNRQWLAKPLLKESIDLFKKHRATSSIQDIVVHASYLINIGSSDEKIECLSKESLVTELNRVQMLGLKYLILHPGSHRNSSEIECLDRIAQNLEYALQSVPGKTMILVENMAGQGSNIGFKFEQLAHIREKVAQKDRIGICFDTCHAFASGYRFETSEQYNAMWKKFDEVVGIEHLKAIHLNDSLKPRGSRVDRHAHILEGQINKEAFSLIMNDTRLTNIPKILETPITTETDYIKDFKILINLISPENQSWIAESILKSYRESREG